MDHKAAFRVVHQSELFVCLLDLDYIHEAGWVRCIRAHLLASCSAQSHSEHNLEAVDAMNTPAMSRMLLPIYFSDFSEPGPSMIYRENVGKCHLAVDLDMALHKDGSHLTPSQGIPAYNASLSFTVADGETLA